MSTSVVEVVTCRTRCDDYVRKGGCNCLRLYMVIEKSVQGADGLNERSGMRKLTTLRKETRSDSLPRGGEGGGFIYSET